MGKATPGRPCRDCGRKHKRPEKFNLKANKGNISRTHSKFSAHTKLKESNHTSCHSAKTHNPSRKTKPKSKLHRSKGLHQIERVTNGSDRITIYENKNWNASNAHLLSSLLRLPSPPKIMNSNSARPLAFLHKEKMRTKTSSCRATGKHKRRNRKPPHGSIKSKMLQLSKSRRSDLPLFVLTQMDKGSSASDKTTFSRRIKSHPTRAIKRSNSSFEPCTSANFCPDRCGEVGSNRCRVSCESLSRRSRMQKSGGNTREPMKSKPRRCECPHKKRDRSPTSQRRNHLPKRSDSPQSIKQEKDGKGMMPQFEANVKKKCAGGLKYQRVDLSPAQSSIGEAKVNEDTNKIPKWKGTFQFKPQNEKQFPVDSTKFAGTVTFTTEGSQSYSSGDLTNPSISSESKRQRFMEEEDDAINNHYGRILMKHCRKAEMKRSCRQEECPEDGEENEYEGSSKSPKINKTCRDRLAIKKAALAGYSYRVNDRRYD